MLIRIKATGRVINRKQILNIATEAARANDKNTLEECGQNFTLDGSTGQSCTGENKMDKAQGNNTETITSVSSRREIHI